MASEFSVKCRNVENSDIFVSDRFLPYLQNEQKFSKQNIEAILEDGYASIKTKTTNCEVADKGNF